MKRDYSLVGSDSELAEKNGLASATWYAAAIPRKRLKELMRRRDGPAIRDTLIWFSALGISGYLGYLNWGTWWAVPCFAVYGVLYGSACDSRWHECGHGTAFKTDWMNNVVYHIGSFMVLRESTSWRWSHQRHHTDTIIVGRDPEIAVPRPPDIPGILMNFLYIKGGYYELRKTVIHSTGRLTKDEETYVPAAERASVYRTARVYLAIYLGFIAWAVAIRSFLPLMYVLLPSFYGAWLMIVYGLTQHAGLAEDVLDHRLNCRTVMMNPINRFLYWNMNYHVEHHMYPMVPYHALPQLHEELKADLPKPYPSIWAAYREIIPTLLRQRKDPRYFVKRELPPSASPLSFDGAATAPET